MTGTTSIQRIESIILEALVLRYLVMPVGELRVAEEDAMRGEEGWRDGLGHVKPEALERVHLKGGDKRCETRNSRQESIPTQDTIRKTTETLRKMSQNAQTYAAQCHGFIGQPDEG